MNRNWAALVILGLSFAPAARALEYYTFDRNSPGLSDPAQAQVILVGDLHQGGENDERDQMIQKLQKQFEAQRLADLRDIHRLGKFPSAVLLLEGVTSHRELKVSKGAADDVQFIQDIEQKVAASADFKIQSIQGWDNVVEVKIRENYSELSAKLSPELQRHYRAHIQPMLTLSLRNYLLAKRIEELVRAYPQSQIFVFAGLFHIHDDFLIELLKEAKVSFATVGGLLGDAYLEKARPELLKELDELKVWDSVAAINRRKVYAQLIQPMLDFIGKSEDLGKHPAGMFFKQHVPGWETRVTQSKYLAPAAK